MVLTADPNIKDLWLPQSPRKAGAHAIVIGVSDYPHLSGGSAPPADLAPDNGGLGQLEVSAKTAAKVFAWLKQTGEIAGAPVATCRLLLAPRPGELVEIDQLTGGAYGPANYVSVRAALEAWGNDIFAGAAEPGPNIAFFFFSGHGTEHAASPALLTKDILNPHSPGGARKAIAFLSLCHAVKTYGIDRALFFVDACRDVPGVARMLNIVGEEILSPYAYPPRHHDALLCLQSTRAGGSAYQVPCSPATIFGQAVIEALDGPPPSYQPYDTTSIPWRLVFRELESHVKQRVRELLAQQTATLIQSVVPYGDPYDGDMLVAQKHGPVPGGTGGAVPPPLASVIATRSASIINGFGRKLDVAAVTAAAAGRGPGELADFAIMHDIFGHEAITDPWISTLRILDVDTDESVPEAVRLAKARSQEVGKTLTAWIDILVMPAEGRAVWIGAGGENDSPSFAVVIPRDLEVSTPVRLDIAFQEIGPHAWSMMSMSARLQDPADLPGDVQEMWGALWDVQRTETLSDLGHAGMVARELEVLERALRDKRRSPVAAAIAATVLLRCGALAELHDWPRNLANWFPWLPDGAVLWAETLLRRDELADRLNLATPPRDTRVGEKPPLREDAAEVRRLVARPSYDEARHYFAMLADRGAPRLAGSLATAAWQEKFFRRVVETEAVTDQAQHDLRDACEVVRRAIDYAVAEGLFAAFVSRAVDLRPHKVLGHRQRRAQAAPQAAARAA
jgi:hypothetical protein